MVRIVTVGTSAITKSFLEALERVEGAELAGICSRDAERGRALAASFEGARAYASVEEAAQDPSVDALYIASPNALHHGQALRAITHGKHVLLEKPATVTAREFAELRAAAENEGVVLMEAMRPVHDPALMTCRDAMARIGTVRRADVRFGKYSSRYDKVLAGERVNVFDARMGGGALRDIGIYCIEVALALLGEPADVYAQGVLVGDPRTTNGAVDGAGTIVARYPDKIATLSFSKITDDMLPTQIEGELGTLTIEGISSPSHAVLCARGETGLDSAGYSKAAHADEELELAQEENSIIYELADFVAACEVVAELGGNALGGWLGSVEDYLDLTERALAMMERAARAMGVAGPTR